jgi:hypothetical protein
MALSAEPRKASRSVCATELIREDSKQNRPVIWSVALLITRAGAFSYQKDKPMDMHCHPSPSGNSHLLEGVLLGVSGSN